MKAYGTAQDMTAYRQHGTPKAREVFVKKQRAEKVESRKALRAKYGFYKKYSPISLGTHFLTMEHLRTANPNVKMVNLMKNLDAYKAKMTKAQHTRIANNSKKMIREYVAKNKAASKKAIKDKAWSALKVYVLWMFYHI